MQAEIITIGDELLIGMTVDSNSAWMGQELTNIGINIHQISSISDNKDDILKAIDTSFSRSEIVLVTGGLGPTSDDITKETIAEYFDSKLVISNSALDYINKLLSARGLQMNENNRKQALVPEKCEVLPNNKGTAPGMLFKRDGKILISMPGVPYEMKDIMTNHVIPYLKNNFSNGIISYRLAMVYGTFEARLAEILEPFEKQLPDNLSLAYLPTSGIIKLRLTARGKEEHLVNAQLDDQLQILTEMIPEYVYAFDGQQLEETVGELLRISSVTISTAESCTGGNIARMLTSVPGSSAYYKGSVIAYHNDIKINKLGVDEKLLINHGAVSEEVAISMAEGVRKEMETDYSVSITGIAGPDGGTEDKPVGTVWIAVCSEKASLARKFSFGNVREHNIRRSSLAAINMLRLLILDKLSY